MASRDVSFGVSICLTLTSSLTASLTSGLKFMRWGKGKDQETPSKKAIYLYYRYIDIDIYIYKDTYRFF